MQAFSLILFKLQNSANHHSSDVCIINLEYIFIKYCHTFLLTCNI